MPKKKKAVKRTTSTTKAQRQARRERIAEWRRKGKTLQEIGEKYGITREAVRQHLVKYNRDAENPISGVYNVRRSNPKMLERRKQVAESRRSGLSYQELADKFHISTAVVRQDIIIYNQTAKHPVPKFVVMQTKLTPEDRRGIVKLRKSGAVCRTIAKKYGVSISLVFKICHEAGVPKPKIKSKNGR